MFTCAASFADSRLREIVLRVCLNSGFIVAEAAEGAGEGDSVRAARRVRAQAQRVCGRGLRADAIQSPSSARIIERSGSIESSSLNLRDAKQGRESLDVWHVTSAWAP